MLYPLFVHNIGALLYHPTNSNRTNAVMAAAERRKLETKGQQGNMAGPGSQPPPSLTHHHSMNSSSSPHGSQPPHSIAPHPGAGRPGLDRAHTFPTPPTSASSGIGMSGQGNSYDWGGQNMNSGVQSGQPLAIETHPHSTPNTPATTPPGATIQQMHSYPGQQPYDSTRPMYSAPAAPQGQYASQQHSSDMGRTQSNSYMKHEMGPPSVRLGTGPQADHLDSKNDGYAHTQGAEQVGHATGDEEADHEHDSDYPHDSNATYNANRGTYYNAPGSGLGTLHADHSHVSPEMNGSPHQNGNGRMTPRTSTGNQSQWASGYHTPPRAAPSSNLYNVMSDTRSSVPNGTTGTENYAPISLQSNYAPSHLNGATTSNKRLRDDDSDDPSRPESHGDDSLKRQKMGRQGSVGGVAGSNAYDRDGRPINRARSSIVQRTHR